jgi:protein phosphatase
MRYQWAVATHKGRVRTNNEDAVYPTTAGSGPGPALFMVADGMGGHVAGEVASQIAVEQAMSTEGPVEQRVEAGNLAILAEATRKPELAGMGTTMTLLEVLPDSSGRLAHVGDSRAYLLRDGELGQITVDHTVVTEYLRAGKLTADQAVDHPQRNMLTRALGLIHGIEVDTLELDLRPGDRILICSDGVSDYVSGEDIHAALAAGTAEEVVWDLVERANRAGGYDNITAVVVDVTEPG